MVSEDLPSGVVQFLESCIDSIEQLKILLLLHSAPARVWSAAEISSELRSTESSITKRLEALYFRKVLLKVSSLDGKHQFSASSDELKAVVQQVAEQNQLRPYRVIEAIYSKPNKSLQAFADAFKLRGDS